MSNTTTNANSISGSSAAAAARAPTDHYPTNLPPLPPQPLPQESLVRFKSYSDRPEPPNRQSVEISDASIELDEIEQKLFDLLRQAAAAAATTSSTTTTTTELRVAGGWVRDKLLKLESHDVDIAVNNMTGVEFAKLVQEYMRVNCHLHPKVGVIAANPDQSKHLETATMNIYGIDVDFCNLRHEVYSDSNSRIPIMKLGTPYEDSLRRDFTINALFYNLMSERIEDWTQHGYADLTQAKQLVTPLPALQTFLDDPLRILRAIRFAMRFDFTLHSDIESTAVQEIIHHNLHVKVSRERVGKELEGMLSGKHASPIQALDCIARLKLAGSVFCFPTGNNRVAGTLVGHEYGRQPHDSFESKHIRELGWEQARSVLKWLPPVLKHFMDAINSGGTSPTIDTKRLLPLAVFLLPFRKLYYTDEPKITNGNNKSSGSNVEVNVSNPQQQHCVVTYMFKEGIKFKNKDVRDTTTIMQLVDDFLVGLFDNRNFTRLEAGLLLRSAKDLWIIILIVATICRIHEQQQANDDENIRSSETVDEKKDNINIDTILQQMISIYTQIIHEYKLDECWKIRPLLDGHAIRNLLSLKRGPEIGEFVEEQIHWMLQYPDGSKQECEVHLQNVAQQKRQQQDETSGSAGGLLGMSDGVGPSSPVISGISRKQSIGEDVTEHFSKKMHVENMDL